jgi:hypothetical protein
LEALGRSVDPLLLYLATSVADRRSRSGPVEGRPDTQWEDINRYLELAAHDIPIVITVSTAPAP